MYSFRLNKFDSWFYKYALDVSFRVTQFLGGWTTH